MGGRLALVVVSECDALPELRLGRQAGDLLDVLIHLGEWEPVGTPDDGPLVNPTVRELDDALVTAFAAASARQASLLFAFVGHGRATSANDYYLMAKNSVEPPGSTTALHLPQRVRELLNRPGTLLDGFVCLVDACEAGESARGAGDRWLEPLVSGGGRMELMVASTDGNAYDGCFTRTLVATARRGQSKSGQYLACADLKPAILTQCQAQTPALLAFDGVTVVRDESVDRGLYLVGNVMRRGGPLAGTTALGIVDQLTRGVLITGPVSEAYQDLAETDGKRLRIITGPAGAGKSTLVSLLLRPELVADDAHGLTLHAAVFLDAASSRESLADVIADQLALTVDGYDQAARDVENRTAADELRTLDAIERRIARPLEHCRSPGGRVRILIDGLDQPERARADLVTAVATLSSPQREGLAHVRVIATVRSTVAVAADPALAHRHLIALPGPSAADVAAAIRQTRGRRDLALDDDLLADLPADGGWLVARLLSEIDDQYLPT